MKQDYSKLHDQRKTKIFTNVQTVIPSYHVQVAGRLLQVRIRQKRGGTMAVAWEREISRKRRTSQLSLPHQTKLGYLVIQGGWMVPISPVEFYFHYAHKYINTLGHPRLAQQECSRSPRWQSNHPHASACLRLLWRQSERLHSHPYFYHHSHYLHFLR